MTFSLGDDPYKAVSAPLRGPAMLPESAPGTMNALGMQKPYRLKVAKGMAGNAHV